MIKEIQYTGYEASTPDNLASDGSLSAAIGLVNQDGGMRAVSKANEVMSLPEGYNIIFKHRISSGEVNYILLNELGDMYWLQEREEISKDKALAGVQFHNFTDIEAVGNTLVLLSGTPHYILWKNGTYNYLGTKVPNIDISFGVRGWHRSIQPETPITFSGDNFFHMPGTGYEQIFTEGQAKLASDQIYATLSKYTAEWGENIGCFTNPFFVRQAITLYDGTVINRSSPVFMMPCRVPHVECSRYEPQNDILKLLYKVHIMSCMLDYQIMNSSKEEIERWKDIIQSIDFYASKPIYLYSTNENLKKLSGKSDDYQFFHGRLCLDTSTNWTLARTINGQTLKSTTCNCTANPFNYAYAGHYFNVFAKLKGEPTPTEFNFPLNEYSDDKIKTIMEGEHPCYKFYSIPVGDLLKDDYGFDFSKDDWVAGKTEAELVKVITNPCGAFTRRVLVPNRIEQLKTIETQPTIDTETDADFYDRDQLLAENINAYNNSVSLYGTKRQYKEPLSPTCMFQYRNAESVYNNTELGCPYAKDFSTTTQYVRILIEEDGERFMLKSYDQKSYRHIDLPASVINDSFIFCPYPNAKYLYLMASTSVFEVELKRHNFLNGAFAWLGNSSNKPLNDWRYLDKIEQSCNPSNTVSLFGKIYTSKLNNPFVFSPSNVYSFSGANVIGMASATKALSQGQFGQFPMYAFTTDGIWALEVSASTGGYSAKQPVTRDVCINPLSITQGDNCIYFVSDRGLMLLSGSDTSCISDILDDHFTQSLTDTLPGYGKFLGIAGVGENAAAAITFREFIREAQIIYDYINQRLIVFKPAETGGTNIAYAYSLASRSWSFVENDIYKKLNSYPEALGVSAGGVVNLSTITDGTEGTGIIVTRPLSLDMPEVHKTVDAIIQRGKFRKGCIKQALWGSRDLIHWHLVASSDSHILRNVHGTPYKWFRIGVIATLKDDEALTGCSINYTPKLTNKIR